MANPRKFSEKIALHNQKQAEETAAFEEIMREVMGATRQGPNESFSTATQPQLLHINSSFNAARAGSLPNVNQIGQHNHQSVNSDKDACIDLQSALDNLQEIKKGCLERSGSVRVDNSHRRNLPNSTNQKRSQSPYSTNNNAYLSPPPPDGHWRRTNSDSALHQSALSANQNLTELQMLAAVNTGGGGGGSNTSPRRSLAMMIDNNNQPVNNLVFTSTGNEMNGNAANWDMSCRTIANSASDKFLLSASLPDQQLRPRSCEVPGINIYPSADENNSSDSIANHHHIPISSNTGSLPDLTNLHFPVPLNSPIDAEEQNGALQGNMMKMNTNTSPNSPYSNGSDSPFSPTSPNNSNLSPPPPCNVMGNYATQNNQSPRRQTSPGPSPSPTASRRRAHHNVNNLVIGNHRHQPHQTQVCSFPPPPQQQQQQQHRPIHIPAQAPNYLNETSQQYSYKSPPRITVEGLAMDTNALSLNGHGVQQQQQQQQQQPQQQQYKPINNQSNSISGNTIMTNASPTFQQQPQFHFNHTQSFQNFGIGMQHRSTTPTDSCSAPTSPASQNISPAHSPELPINSNSNGSGGGGGCAANQQFNNSYSSYSNQQANILQHQLEQFRMTNETDTNNFMMSCNTNGPNSNVFYLESLNSVDPISNVDLYTDSLISQQNADLPSSPNQISSENISLVNDSIFYNSSQMSFLNSMPNNTISSNMYVKTEMYNSQSVASPTVTVAGQQLSNSSHCTTPQTPTSIPDIILTGPNNLDDLQSANDFCKDLTNTMANMSSMGSFDSDIFCSATEELRTGTFDSFDLDSLQILPDIDSNTE